MNILFDVDGVLIDHNAYFLGQLNEKFGTNYQLSDVTAFDYREVFPHEQAAFLFGLWQGSSIYEEVDPDHDMLGLVDGLRDEGHRVIACSSPLVGHIQNKFEFLRTIGFEREDIILATDKGLVKGDVLIDDHAPNLIDFVRTNLGLGLLLDQPWNKSFITQHHDRSNIVRVFEVWEIEEEIRQYARL